MASRSIAIVQATDADVLIKVGTGVYCGATLLGAADGTLKIYDAVSVATIANDKLIAVLAVDADQTPGQVDNPPEPVRFTLGLVAVITGAANLATVRYK